MKKRSWKRIMALMLCGLLCACGAPQVQSNPDKATGTAGWLEVVDTAEKTDNLGRQGEYPSIHDEEVLLRAQGMPQVAATSLFSGGGSVSGEIKSVWISYLEWETLLKDKTEAQFRSNISGVFDNVKDFGLNTVVVQVRPFGDALYNSSYFPWSYTITGTEGKNPGFDPLQVMVAEAKSRGLRIEAWVNPYRVRAAGNTKALAKDNPAQLWLESGDSAVIRYNGIVSYNPASKKARELIVNGVVEIVENYNVDAIHIDDYFYPTTDAAFDKSSYDSYVSGGGTMSQADWRRSNVETLIKSMYSAIKAADSSVLFGISPQGNVDNNYNGQYLDVKKIVSTSGYCDYICPQVYYGFDNESQPFAQVVKNWNDMCSSSVDLYIGIAAYKVGTQDNWAGSGKNEWVSKTNRLQSMVETSRELDSYGGFIIYRYDSLFRPASGVSAQVNKEYENLKKIV